LIRNKYYRSAGLCNFAWRNFIGLKLFQRIIFLSTALQILLFGWAWSGSEEDLKMGIRYFEERYTCSPDYHSNPKNIDLSIECLERALKDSKTREQAGEHLLWAYFYKAMFICENKSCKKFFLAKGKSLGDRLSSEFSDNINIKYGFSVNTGRWSEVHGVFASAWDGVASKIKQAVESAMMIDPDYGDGLGYRLLGILYFKAPYIPVILPWADKTKAIEKVKFAATKWPESIGNQLTLGELYYWGGDMKRSRDIFSKMQNMTPRPKHLTLDQYEIDKAANYIREIDLKLAHSRTD
jgi:tetratricopeptide (TPR) repeat protein